jgi:hypothetical protein
VNETLRELWVAGYPGWVGGADTELDSMVDLWTARGVRVHLVPLSPPDAKMRAKCDVRGATTHEYRPDIFHKQVVTSFCNGDFLKALPAIHEAGKPAAVVWANCMTWLFDAERTAHAAGLIDYFIFQSKYQRNRLVPELSRYRPVRELAGYRAYYNPDPGLFRPPAAGGGFCAGRVSRDDPAKFSSDMWEIFRRIAAPNGKKIFVLGFSDKVAAVTGQPHSLDYQWWSAGSVPPTGVYRKLHVLVHKTGGSRENWPRVILEAYAHGVVPIVENSFGNPEMVIDGVTGFLCDDSNEMVFRASQLAHDDRLRVQMAANGYGHLKELCDADLCWTPWESLLSPRSLQQDPADPADPAVREPLPPHDPDTLRIFKRLWRELFTSRHGSPTLTARVFDELPCELCRDHTADYVLTNAPVYGPGWFEWVWAFRNSVNRRRGEAEPDLATAAKWWGRTDVL